MSGKEQAALSFSKCGPKSLCIRITGAFLKRASFWGPLLEVLIQQLWMSTRTLYNKLPR